MATSCAAAGVVRVVRVVRAVARRFPMEARSEAVPCSGDDVVRGT